jgi:hypothetical protein
MLSKEELGTGGAIRIPEKPEGSEILSRHAAHLYRPPYQLLQLSIIAQGRTAFKTINGEDVGIGREESLGFPGNVPKGSATRNFLIPDTGKHRIRVGEAHL